MHLKSERGAIIIHVAIALVALLGFAAIVVDYGAMWVARGQAQAAADAGALAGAHSILDAPTNLPLATQTAFQFAGAQNVIWGQTTANANIVVSPLPFACPASAGGGNSCIRVDVMRGTPDRTGTGHGNTLPTYFGGIIGINSQGVRATATAQVASGNALRCIKPWIVADKWIDHNTGASGGLLPNAWDQMDDFSPPTDTYSAPGFKAAGANNDYGTQLVLKQGNVGTWSSGWTQQIDFGTTGSSAYRAEIAGCPGYVPTVGLYDGSIPCAARGDTPDPERGCISVKTGMAAGPTSQGVGDLIGRDPTSTWDTGTNSVSGGCMVVGSCVDENGNPTTISPRIAPLALFNTLVYYNEANSGACSGTGCVAQVVNLLGFFIEGMCNDVYPNVATRPAYCGTPSEANKAVVGRLMAYPGQTLGSAGPATPASFIKITRLVQ